MKNPQISVIMLTHNRPQFVGCCIEHVLAQKNCSFEYIIINNGSTDNTLSICEQYAARDSRIRLFTIPGSSIGAGRNVGLDHARGKYITFVDDDDYMAADMLAYLLELAEENAADISVCGCYTDYGDRIEPFYLFENKLLLDRKKAVEEFLKRSYYNSANPCKLFKAELFEHIRYEEQGKYDDIHTLYRLFVAAQKTACGGEGKYYFRKHGFNNSGFIQKDNLTPEQLREYLSAFAQRTQYITQRLPEAAACARWSEWSYMISMVEKITTNRLVNCEEILAQIKEAFDSHFDEFCACEFLSARDKELIARYSELKNKTL